MKLLFLVVGNALAVGAAAWLIDGIGVSGSSTGDRIFQLALVGALFGVVSSLVKPVVKLLSLPFIILTLGLFLLVINALMLLLTSKLADVLGMGFHVDGFWTAVLGGIVISIVSWLIEAVLPDRDER